MRTGLRADRDDRFVALSGALASLSLFLHAEPSGPGTAPMRCRLERMFAEYVAQNLSIFGLTPSFRVRQGNLGHVSDRAHNPKVASSNLAKATN